MIASLTGTVSVVRPPHIILDVHGVGYLVAVRNPFDFVLGSTCTLRTHLAVRENAMDLYGFTSDAEIRMFEYLIQIPKIGPKSAMQILSQADISLLTTAIVQNDPSYLSKMSGIGNKTAEKIVNELRDKFEKLEGETFLQYAPSGDTDVVDALIALGYSQKDARDALQKLPPEITETNQRIKEALKSLSS